LQAYPSKALPRTKLKTGRNKQLPDPSSLSAPFRDLQRPPTLISPQSSRLSGHYGRLLHLVPTQPLIRARPILPHPAIAPFRIRRRQRQRLQPLLALASGRPAARVGAGSPDAAAEERWRGWERGAECGSDREEEVDGIRRVRQLTESGAQEEVRSHLLPDMTPPYGGEASRPEGDDMELIQSACCLAICSPLWLFSTMLLSAPATLSMRT
jgi:hypothetical protein